MNEKLIGIMAQQSKLLKKAAQEKLNDEEKAELEELNKAVDALSDAKNINVGKTSKKQMTLKEFAEFVNKEMEEAGLDPKRLALLKQNIESVKGQEASSADDIVTINVMLKAEDQFEELTAKIDKMFELVKSFSEDQRTRTGLREDDTEENLEKSAYDTIAEALQIIAEKFVTEDEEVKDKFEKAKVELENCFLTLKESSTETDEEQGEEQDDTQDSDSGDDADTEEDVNTEKEDDDFTDVDLAPEVDDKELYKAVKSK